MEKIHEIKGTYPGFITLPYTFDNVGDRPLKTQRLIPNRGFQEIVSAIPKDASVYFTVQCSGACWWGRGINNLKETYKIIQANQNTVFAVEDLTFSNLVNVTDVSVEISPTSFQVPQTITLGVSYQQPTGEYSVLITKLTYDRVTTFDGTKSSLRELNTETYILNNVDHQHIRSTIESKFRDTNYSGETYSGSRVTVESPVDRYVHKSSVPISNQLQDAGPVPLFGQFSKGNFLQYRSGYIGTTRVLLYDTSVSFEHLVSQTL